jgi:hypothetical protein
LANDFWFLADISFPPLAALIIGIHITELRVGCQSKSESECDFPSSRARGKCKGGFETRPYGLGARFLKNGRFLIEERTKD